MPVALSQPDERWPHEYAALALQLRRALRDAALAIDHIGSTAVPDLPAKDVIDVQVIVGSLAATEDVLRALARIGFIQRPGP